MSSAKREPRPATTVTYTFDSLRAIPSCSDVGTVIEPSQRSKPIEIEGQLTDTDMVPDLDLAQVNKDLAKMSITCTGPADAFKKCWPTVEAAINKYWKRKKTTVVLDYSRADYRPIGSHRHEEQCVGRRTEWCDLSAIGVQPDQYGFRGTYHGRVTFCLLSACASCVGLSHARAWAAHKLKAAAIGRHPMTSLRTRHDICRLSDHGLERLRQHFAAFRPMARTDDYQALMAIPVGIVAMTPNISWHGTGRIFWSFEEALRDGSVCEPSLLGLDVRDQSY